MSANRFAGPDGPPATRDKDAGSRVLLKRIRGILNGLLGGLDAEGLGGLGAPVAGMSGGERRRMALAALADDNRVGELWGKTLQHRFGGNGILVHHDLVGIGDRDAGGFLAA